MKKKIVRMQGTYSGPFFPLFFSGSICYLASTNLSTLQYAIIYWEGETGGDGRGEKDGDGDGASDSDCEAEKWAKERDKGMASHKDLPF